MEKKDYRLDIKDDAKEGKKAAIISVTFLILIIYIFGWVIQDYIPETGICKTCKPQALKILLNYPFHYFGGAITWYVLNKILFKFLIKSKWMDKNNHSLL